jgi:hypothetical protein
MTYATFKTPQDNTVQVKGRKMSASAWITAWALGGIPVGLILGGLLLFALCKGWISWPVG